MGVHLVRDHPRYFEVDSCDFWYDQRGDHGYYEGVYDAYLTEIIGIMGARTISFHEFRTCRDPELFREMDPIASKRLLADMVNIFRTEDGIHVS